MRNSRGKRSWIFYFLASFFGLYVLFLYGPLSTIIILSFQGPTGGLTFPMNGFSTQWFSALFGQQRVGDFVGSFWRSLALGLVVMVLSVVIGTMVGAAYRSRFRGSNVLFYLSVSSLVVPSILISLGIGLLFDQVGITTNWFSSALGAQLTWTLPFAFLIMLAVFTRFNRSYEEAARDLGASDTRAFFQIVIPIIAPSLVGVGLLGFSLSYDEFARSLMVVGENNTLPLEIFGMTTNVTTPTLYALGTLTTAFSFVIIAGFLVTSNLLRRRTAALKTAGDEPEVPLDPHAHHILVSLKEGTANLVETGK